MLYIIEILWILMGLDIIIEAWDIFIKMKPFTAFMLFLFYLAFAPLFYIFNLLMFLLYYKPGEGDL